MDEIAKEWPKHLSLHKRKTYNIFFTGVRSTNTIKARDASDYQSTQCCGTGSGTVTF
jgi:hypothetical protein